MNQPARLADILEALEMQHDMVQWYVDRHTGRTVMVTDEDFALAEDDALAGDAADWQQPAIATARQVLADENAERFVPLPDAHDIHEWAIMKRFAQHQSGQAAVRLLDALHGSGAFRFFRNTLADLGLSEQWNAFRDEALRQIALDWCQANNIRLTPEDAREDAEDNEQ